VTPQTPAPPPLPAPPAAPRRRWLLLGAALALLLAGGAAGGWWWWRGRTPPAPPAEPPLPADIQDAEVREAVEHARQEVITKPNSAAAWGHLGMLLEAHLYEADADRCFTEAARLDPADPRWPYFRGLYALKYDPDHALPFLRQADEAARSKPEYASPVRLRLAEALLERGERDEAGRLFDEVYRREPGNPRAAFGLGLVALERGDDRAAEPLLRVAQASPTARRAATARLAALARNRGDPEAAARYEKEAAPRPGDALAWPDPLVEPILDLQTGRYSRTQEAERLEQDRRYREAAQLWLDQLADKPTVRAYLGAGINLVRVGEFDKGLGLLRDAVGLDPDGAQTHFVLALALFTRAEKRWHESPGAPEARGWFAEAAGEARRATDLKPDHARAYLIRGLSLKYLGRTAEAVEPLRKGVTCRPIDIDLQVSLGEALLETGQLKEAETHLENARKLDPKDPRVIEALERLRKKKG
jgi:Flp pilus assembly protein TadD